MDEQSAGNEVVLCSGRIKVAGVLCRRVDTLRRERCAVVGARDGVGATVLLVDLHLNISVREEEDVVQIAGDPADMVEVGLLDVVDNEQLLALLAKVADIFLAERDGIDDVVAANATKP